VPDGNDAACVVLLTEIACHWLPGALFDLSLHLTSLQFSLFSFYLQNRFVLAIHRGATTVVGGILSSIDQDDFGLVVEAKTVEKHRTNACGNANLLPKFV
jgi:hypothetical protein